ncbi:uncharacterized protein LOC131619123 [Vicia villosa]|uniref:uncharacterized protein LOC131619123 n=1 Tax=Vicia villosa TaxID=3911 RepID=UPI00273BF267|nr:uncharacterized protein LOC131619123 [Vicia villosa]
MGGDSNCGFRTVSGLLGKGKENHNVVHQTLILKLMVHRELYTRLYGKKEESHKIHNALVPCVSGSVPVGKCVCFPKVGHLIVSAYDRVCIDLTRYGFSETFFQLWSRPSQDPSGHIICIGYIRSLHFVRVYLKLGCPIPATSVEWTTHFAKEAETWSDHFLEMMTEFTKLSELERESNRKKSKKEPVLDLSSDNSFGAF